MHCTLQCDGQKQMNTLNAGTAICDCESGLIPNPDTITGCVYHPCNPTPCGLGANCFVDDAGLPVCKCIPGLDPRPDPVIGCGTLWKYDGFV